MFLLPARIELDFSEMTMNVIECDGERKVKRSSVFFSNGGWGGWGIDSNPVWKSESDRFWISSAPTLLGSKVTLLQS